MLVIINFTEKDFLKYLVLISYMYLHSIHIANFAIDE